MTKWDKMSRKLPSCHGQGVTFDSIAFSNPSPKTEKTRW